MASCWNPMWQPWPLVVLSHRKACRSRQWHVESNKGAVIFPARERGRLLADPRVHLGLVAVLQVVLRCAWRGAPVIASTQLKTISPIPLIIGNKVKRPTVHWQFGNVVTRRCDFTGHFCTHLLSSIEEVTLPFSHFPRVLPSSSPHDIPRKKTHQELCRCRRRRRRRGTSSPFGSGTSGPGAHGRP